MELFFLIFIVLVIIQWYFKMKQTKVAHTYYNKFIESGHVLAERKKGIFSGAVVMFQLDDDANIQQCVSMSGATFFASWDECKELIHKNLLKLEEKDLENYKKPVRLAIDKAIKTYQKSLEQNVKQP